MIAGKRKKHILKSLDKTDYISVNDLVKELDVSHMTIRRDLNGLEAEGYLIRQYGGALKSKAVENLFSFSRRVSRKKEQKEAICKTAAGYIQDNDVIFIDCGTTLFRICKYILNKKNLRIITNSLPVVSELINCSHIKINFIGGEVVHDRKAVYGMFAEKALDEYRANKAFIGADGISLKNGLSSYDEKEGKISGKMAANANKVYLLCDSSKIEQDSFFKMAPVSIIDHLITDKNINKQLVHKYKKNKIKVIIAD